MKKKINNRFYLVSIISILVTVIVFLFVFYSIYKKQIIEDLKIYAGIIIEEESFTEWDNSKIRETYISSDGKVIYDSQADAENMENHGLRPEVVEAKENGYGYAFRKSDTIGKTTYYYAVLLEDGNVLRVSRDASSITSFFVYVLEIITGLSIVLVVISFGVLYFINKNITRPIEEMAIDNDKMRREFSANVSHELKTPLTAISGYAQIIEQGMAKKEDIPKFAGKIHKESERMLNLINDIIKISELDEKGIVYEPEKINLFELAKECTESLMEHAESKNIKIIFEGSPAYIYGKPTMIYEVIYNLVDNAIRYNVDGGKVNVSVYPVEDEIELVVEDTGIGIKKKYQSRVFERFYRVDKSHSRVTGGTGLGLSIVKHAVAAHEGRIILESKENIGTKISVIFKQKKDA